MNEWTSIYTLALPLQKYTHVHVPAVISAVTLSAYTSNADMIQPGLTPLQPSLDDLMDIPGNIILLHYNNIILLL